MFVYLSLLCVFFGVCTSAVVTFAETVLPAAPVTYLYVCYLAKLHTRHANC